MKKDIFRLDTLLMGKGLTRSRNHSQAVIIAGKVMVNDRIVDKPGSRFSSDVAIKLLKPPHPYVSRGGVKLQHALEEFKLNVKGLVCMDVGASTGGFTDCLLKHGARKVYAVDVGYGQMDWSLRQDPRIVLIERTNIRYMPKDALDEQPDLATVDTSFISLKIVVPALLKHLKHNAYIITLVKPQFEAGKGKVGKGGIVRDSMEHQKILSDLKNFFTLSLDLKVMDITESPILGAKGNKEFFMLLRAN